MKYARKHKTCKTSKEVEWLSIMWRHIFPLCWNRSRQPVSYPVFLLSMLKPIAPWSLAFSRATGRLHAFTSSCHWLPLIISFTRIGRCDYFGFGLRHSTEKRSRLYHLSVTNNKGRRVVGLKERKGFLSFSPEKGRLIREENLFERGV